MGVLEDNDFGAEPFTELVVNFFAYMGVAILNLGLGNHASSLHAAIRENTHESSIEPCVIHILQPTLAHCHDVSIFESGEPLSVSIDNEQSFSLKILLPTASES